MRDSRALLGNTAAAGSIFFPVGPLHHGVCLCRLFQFVLPWLAPALLFCAFSVAVSRVVLGMHFLSDVVVGALLGTLLAYMVMVERLIG